MSSNLPISRSLTVTLDVRVAWEALSIVCAFADQDWQECVFRAALLSNRAQELGHAPLWVKAEAFVDSLSVNQPFSLDRALEALQAVIAAAATSNDR